ncbi:hypothetical protein EG329_013427 [Mollisiaceae sp. DMI_Dod_QoI]|nr:hypothetical protein EG329_013427 [Helotiales sp. DMI_Dod_QoI]
MSGTPLKITKYPSVLRFPRIPRIRKHDSTTPPQFLETEAVERPAQTLIRRTVARDPADFFGIFFLLETEFKVTIDSLQRKYQSMTRPLTAIKPLPAPEFPLLWKLPIEKYEGVENMIQSLAARHKPFKATFTPYYSRCDDAGQRGSSKTGYHIGYDLSSKGDEHLEILSQVSKSIFADHPNHYETRRTMIIQPDLTTSEEARKVYHELMEIGKWEFQLTGMAVKRRSFLSEKGGRVFRIERKEFMFEGKEESGTKVLLETRHADGLQTEVVKETPST